MFTFGFSLSLFHQRYDSVGGIDVERKTEYGESGEKWKQVFSFCLIGPEMAVLGRKWWLIDQIIEVLLLGQ